MYLGTSVLPIGKHNISDKGSQVKVSAFLEYRHEDTLNQPWIFRASVNSFAKVTKGLIPLSISFFCPCIVLMSIYYFGMLQLSYIYYSQIILSSLEIRYSDDVL